MSDVSEVKPSLQDELVALVKGLVEKKPTTSSEALILLHDLDVKLGVWVVSELSASDQKEVLATKWAINEVHQVASSWCFPKKK
jgi:hypothetical protein